MKFRQKNKITLYTAHDGMTVCGTRIGSLANALDRAWREANEMRNPRQTEIVCEKRSSQRQQMQVEVLPISTTFSQRVIRCSNYP